MQEMINFLSHHSALSLSALFIFLLLVLMELKRAAKSRTALTTAEVTHKINKEQAVVIDLRSNEQYRKGHIIDAILLSAQEVSEGKKLEKYRAKPIILVCSTGTESDKLAQQLLKKGYNIYTLSGGIRTWAEAQMPLVK